KNDEVLTTKTQSEHKLLLACLFINIQRTWINKRKIQSQLAFKLLYWSQTNLEIKGKKTQNGYLLNHKKKKKKKKS
nr:hypothetical protein [Candidatus Liberibacter asiaticus]